MARLAELVRTLPGVAVYTGELERQTTACTDRCARPPAHAPPGGSAAPT
jgi:hypothetical protein